ncbi:CxC2 domain-containing protein [Salix suchowensis]|nr:CxC2 domain-containing protein [Salix suchowensis]
MVFLEVLDTYLHEMMRHEGLGDNTSPGMCTNCRTETVTRLATVRCKECFDRRLYCHTCIVSAHERMPLHRIEEWNGDYFAPSCLKSLGLRIQLGHPHGERCVNPQPAFDDTFTIVDSASVHEVSLDFCGCETAKLPIIQLLRHCLFPATSVAPRSAATFAALDHFHMLSLEGKLSAFEFWRALARTTDKTEINPPPDRYEALLRMMREWRHLLLLKRGGRCNDPAGPSGTAPGELALKCPACPHPNINLPMDWETAPAGKA